MASFYICLGAPLQIQSAQIQKDLVRHKLDYTTKRAPLKPNKIWRKKDQGKIDQGHQQVTHKSTLQDTSQEQSQNNVDQNLDQDLNSSQQQMHVTFPNQMLENSVSTLQQKALIGKFSSDSLSFLDIKNWAFNLWSGLIDIFLS